MQCKNIKLAVTWQFQHAFGLFLGSRQFVHRISGLLLALLEVSVGAFLSGLSFGGVRKQSALLFIFHLKELLFVFHLPFQRKCKFC